MQKVPVPFQLLLCMCQDIGGKKKKNQQIWSVNVQPGTVKNAKH